MTEEWKTIPSFSGYEASSLGGIRRKVGGKGTHSGRILKPSLHPKHNYFFVKLKCSDQRWRNVAVHRLVCEAFHGPCPPKLECAHGDGIRTNCQSSNLRWTTRRDNHADKIIHGTHQAGENNANAKLTADDIRLIRQRRDASSDLALEYGVCRSAISHIRTHKRWRHIP